jgi:hypothetical protein
VDRIERLGSATARITSGIPIARGSTIPLTSTGTTSTIPRLRYRISHRNWIDLNANPRAHRDGQRCPGFTQSLMIDCSNEHLPTAPRDCEALQAGEILRASINSFSLDNRKGAEWWQSECAPTLGLGVRE